MSHSPCIWRWYRKRTPWVVDILKAYAISLAYYKRLEWYRQIQVLYASWRHQMETFSALLALVPLTKASDAELWCFFFICAWINRWVSNREAGNLRPHRTHYDVNVMSIIEEAIFWTTKTNIFLTHLTLVPYICFSESGQHWFRRWASYQIRKIAGCACAGNAGNVSPRRRFQMKPLVSDPGMHHGTCVTHVPWCMSGSLTCGDGENVPGIPGACAPAILRIWQEAHGLSPVRPFWRQAITWTSARIVLIGPLRTIFN